MNFGSIALIALLTSSFSQVTFAAPSAPKLNPFSKRMKLAAGTASCVDHAKEVAAAFALGATQAQAVTGVCQSRQTVTSVQGDTYELDIVLINYLATTEQVPAYTVFGANAFLNTPNASAGVYATHAECLNEIAQQTPIFTQETGLTPFAAYCQPSTNDMYPGFSMTIESFGEFKKRKLFTFSMDGQAKFGADGSQVTQAALATIKTLGARVVSVSATRIFYYFEYPISISTPVLGIFDEVEQCTSQMATAHAIYAKAELVGVSSFCLVSPPPIELIGKVKDAYVLTAVYAGHGSILDSSAARYDTFSECMSDIDRLVQNAHSNGRSVLGGICAPNHYGQGGYDARLFQGLY